MISKLKFYLSLIIARCAYIGIRLLNKSSGTSFVGMLVLKICPDFLKYCSKYIKKRITQSQEQTANQQLPDLLHISLKQLIKKLYTI